MTGKEKKLILVFLEDTSGERPRVIACANEVIHGDREEDMALTLHSAHDAITNERIPLSELTHLRQQWLDSLDLMDWTIRCQEVFTEGKTVQDEAPKEDTGETAI